MDFNITEERLPYLKHTQMTGAGMVIGNGDPRLI